MGRDHGHPYILSTTVLSDMAFVGKGTGIIRETSLLLIYYQCCVVRNNLPVCTNLAGSVDITH